ncbi:endonuclease domain-containing protein [Acidipropionibacterium virtanenii]|uniref:Restriction endonuclease type II-like domain-containing protein n=1 Tax=Acidipropionibacterium virtanenii TaxID=2057246 RepID=A0A344UWW2_9ACTN|nr:DUF559 domain-containing protein [Acidipropionibacterium virtanenii]AXE39760.1 hypothetical protein JS278_02622 [Acidipropionibacterium virtanenii]
MDPSRAADPNALIRAVWMWRTTAIVTGRAALREQGMRSLQLDGVDVLLPYSFADRGPYRFHRCRFPEELVTDWTRGPTASTGAAAVHLGTRRDWETLCEAIRTDTTNPAEIAAACERLRGHIGAEELDLTARLLSDSPWSVAEVWFDELLRRAGITGWTANLDVFVDTPLGTRKFVVDCAFEAERLAVEVNSAEWHDNPRAFQQDAEKARMLTGCGWTVVPITPTQIKHDPDAVLADLRARLHRRHRPERLPTVHFQPDAPFWW